MDGRVLLLRGVNVAVVFLICLSGGVQSTWPQMDTSCEAAQRTILSKVRAMVKVKPHWPAKCRGLRQSLGPVGS